MKSEMSCKSALLVNSAVEFTVFSQLAFCCSFLTISTINTNYVQYFCAQSYSFGDKRLKRYTSKRPNGCYIALLKVNLKQKTKKGSKTRSETKGREDSVVVIFLCFPLLCTAK